MLLYFLKRVAMKLEKEIRVFFRISADTRNRHDVSFGFVKPRLKQKTFLNDGRWTMSFKKAPSNIDVSFPSKLTGWTAWNFSQFSTVPSTLKLTQYHVIWFTFTDPTKIEVKHLSGGVKCESSRQLKTTHTPKTWGKLLNISGMTLHTRPFCRWQKMEI